jgi:hypothetical protein
MVRATLQRGSKGSAVSELQTILNKNGYNLSVDGDFGEKTEAAVRDYQQKNGLGVDGIVGVNTWGKLAPEVKVETPKFEYIKFAPDPFTKSEDLTAAEGQSKAAEDAVANYGDFAWDKQGEYDALYDKYTKRDPFSYDFNADALYQQYKDRYMQQGKMAMQDVMGQAAAMTGGYGNSYAASVGNQAYQQSLQQLNDVIPELYQLAYNRYNQEGQDMLNAMGLLEGDRAFDYGMHTDKYGRLVSDRGYYGDKANNLYGREYGEYMDALGIEQSEHKTAQGYEYQLGRDSVADAQWQANFDEAVRQFDESQLVSTGSPIVNNKSDTIPNTGNLPSGDDWDNGGYSPDVVEKEVPDYVHTKAATFESNTALANYLDGLEGADVISPEQADALYAQYVDDNEKTSYKDMVGSTNGWTVVDDGGTNWLWGVDEDGIVKAPNGEQFSLDALVDKLVEEGMTRGQARDAVKALQKKLKI